MTQNDRVTRKHAPLRELFLAHQGQMEAELSRFRTVVAHPTSKGDGSEKCWRKMLATYLPNRYCVKPAHIVDYEGNLSEHIDVVIFDQQYTPFLFHQGGVYFIPAEAVYAVFEVKQEINAENIRYAGKKARSVRKLRRTSSQIPHAGGVYPAKSLHHITAGILTLDCSWRDGLGDTFKRNVLNLQNPNRLDLGCVLRTASFLCSHSSVPPAINVSDAEDALITFFLRLSAELQKIGTVPAIDLATWAKPLSLQWIPLEWETAEGKGVRPLP